MQKDSELTQIKEQSFKGSFVADRPSVQCELRGILPFLEFLPAPFTLSQFSLFPIEWTSVCDVYIASEEYEGYGEPGKNLGYEIGSQVH